MSFKQDTETTRAMFRRFKDDGALFVLFVDNDEGRGLCSSYMHVGQHGAANRALCCRISRPAALDDPEVIALARELEGAPYGYRLRPIKRYSRARP